MSGQLLKKTVQLGFFKRCSLLASLDQSRAFAEEKSLVIVKPGSAYTNKPFPKSSERLKTIAVTDTEDLSIISGIPEQHVKERLVRIYPTSKNAMQSGTNNVGHWEMEFETRERWENPLMGWSSTGDPQSNMKIQFINKESAIEYARKNGYTWFLEPEKKEKSKVKSYAFNFSWNKRSRVSTK